MIYKVLRFVSHIFNSSNQYSVHSPVVYKLLTECIYKEERKILKKNIQFLNLRLVNLYKKQFLIHTIDNILSNKVSEILEANGRKKENTILLIKNIKLKNEYSCWKKLIIGKEIQVSIDFYYFGILILKVHKLQKQDYIIRL
ncbi:MAG: hypothetical protein OR998_03550 [Flavobacteriaceae bacterium]|nr:hypothetical protein [Flavobacteriaceae bacterium]